MHLSNRLIVSTFSCSMLISQFDVVYMGYRGVDYTIVAEIFSSYRPAGFNVRKMWLPGHFCSGPVHD